MARNYLSQKAKIALRQVIAKFQSGDISPVIKIAMIHRDPRDNMPSSRWSFNNQILALSQGGEIDCRTYLQWKSVGRTVIHKPRHVYILRPLMGTVTTNIEDSDEGTEVKYYLRGYKDLLVYPISSTRGKALPTFTYTPRQLPELSFLAKQMGIAVKYAPGGSKYIGMYTSSTSPTLSTKNERIDLHSQDPQVFWHELGHALHARVSGGLSRFSESHKEVVAELFAGIIAQMYGRDISGNVWQYISRYSNDPLMAISQAMSDIEQMLLLIDTLTVKG